MSADSVGLTPKQQRFIDEYLTSLNATDAARKAGYSVKTAEVQGPRLLGNVRVKAEIAARQKKLADKYEVTQERVVRELALLGFSNMADYMRPDESGQPILDFSSLSREQAAALQEVTTEAFVDARTGDQDAKEGRSVRRVKFKLADKGSNLERLAKHLGMFVEKHEHTGNLSLTVETGVPRGGDSES